MDSPQSQVPPRKERVLMEKLYHISCPKCNNNHSFYRYDKDKDRYQKYQCRKCKHQFAPDKPVTERERSYPSCPICGKSSFLHHDYEHYSNYPCCDKNATIHFLYQNQQQSALRQCQSCLAKQTSKECDTLCKQL